MGLIDRLAQWAHHDEVLDVVVGKTEKTERGYRTFLDVEIAKDVTKVRMDRIRNDVNDFDIPIVEDPENGIQEILRIKTRRLVYSFGDVSDEETYDLTVKDKMGLHVSSWNVNDPEQYRWILKYQNGHR